MTDVDVPEVAAAPPPRPDSRRYRPARLIGYVVTLLVISGITAWIWTGNNGSSSSDEARDSTPETEVAPSAAPAPTVTPTTTAPVVAPPLRAPTPEAPLSVWFSGDSTAYTIGNALKNQNGEGLMDIELRLRTSSGMSRPDFFDWNVFLGAVVDLNPPDVMLLSMGANDAQGVTSPDGVVHPDIHSQDWRDEYLRRVDELSRRITEKGTRLYWIGQPIAREPGYNAFVGVVDSIYQEIDDRYDDVTYIDTYQLLADDTLTYTDTKPGPDGQPWSIRQPDGIHLDPWGGELVAQEILAELRRDWLG